LKCYRTTVCLSELVMSRAGFQSYQILSTSLCAPSNSGKTDFLPILQPIAKGRPLDIRVKTVRQNSSNSNNFTSLVGPDCSSRFEFPTRIISKSLFSEFLSCFEIVRISKTAYWTVSQIFASESIIQRFPSLFFCILCDSISPFVDFPWSSFDLVAMLRGQSQKFYRFTILCEIMNDFRQRSQIFWICTRTIESFSHSQSFDLAVPVPVPGHLHVAGARIERNNRVMEVWDSQLRHWDRIVGIVENRRW
jgi:hypothetical protein